MLLLYILYGSFLFRFRGGLGGDFIIKYLPFWGTTLTRLTFSFLLLLPLITKLSIFYIPASILLYLGCIMRLYPWQYQLNQPTDLICLSLRGLLYTLPLGIINPFFILVGLLQGPCYLLGTYLPTINENYPWSTPHEMSTSDWGEYIFGAVLGLSVGLI